MAKFRVEIETLDVTRTVYEVEADSKDEAEEKANDTPEDCVVVDGPHVSNIDYAATVKEIPE